MCYICKCFGWGLDFVQRVLTFALACIMCCAICVGISVAIAAGIAYGYNYMLAEFLATGRQDLSVYVRRGQFHDRPDFGKGFRRRGDENDMFSSNASDYQDTKVDSDSKPLSDTWRKALDTRKYAEKLTKYSYGRFGANFNGSRISDVAGREDAYATGPPPPERTVVRRVFSVTPNPDMATTILLGQTDIVMRNFKPDEIMSVSPESKAMDGEFYEESNRASMDVIPKPKEKTPDIKISLKELSKSKYVPMRTPAKSAHSDYPAEEVDEDNIVYKPV